MMLSTMLLRVLCLLLILGNSRSDGADKQGEPLGYVHLLDIPASPYSSVSAFSISPSGRSLLIMYREGGFFDVGSLNPSTGALDTKRQPYLRAEWAKDGTILAAGQDERLSVLPSPEGELGGSVSPEAAEILVFEDGAGKKWKPDDFLETMVTTKNGNQIAHPGVNGLFVVVQGEKQEVSPPDADSTRGADLVIRFSYDDDSRRILARIGGGYVIYDIDSKNRRLLPGRGVLPSPAYPGERLGFDVDYFLIAGEDFLLIERTFSTESQDKERGTLGVCDLDGSEICEIPIGFPGCSRFVKPYRITASKSILAFFSSEEGGGRSVLKIMKKVKAGE